MIEPRYRHDCDSCRFLGIYEDADLYYCNQKMGGKMILPTVIARRSSLPPDYISGLSFSDHVPALAEAKRLAIKEGLL